jgi:lycopene cyclase domain-containing protein
MSWIYPAVLAGCLLATLPLELVLKTRVYAQPRRLVATLVPVLAVFVPWDALAVHAGHWHYQHLLGARLGDLPVEELAFFLVVPVCSILTLEAVRRRRPQWLAGEESP